MLKSNKKHLWVDFISKNDYYDKNSLLAGVMVTFDDLDRLEEAFRCARPSE